MSDWDDFDGSRIERFSKNSYLYRLKSTPLNLAR